jgi:hypothetical protein
MSDWEGAMVIWRSADGGNWWTRDSIRIDQHGKRHELAWSEIPNTFNGSVVIALLQVSRGWYC